MAEEKEIVIAKITNAGPGPRMVLMSDGGNTLQKGQSVTIRCNYKELKAIEPYVKLGHLRLEEGREEDLPNFEAASGDIGGDMPTPSSPVDKVLEGQTGDITPVNDIDDEDDDLGGPDSTDGEGGQDAQSADATPDSVIHRGFGRYYGFKNGEPVTEAMNKQEAEVFATENGLQLGADPDPSNDGVTEEAPAEDAPAEDTTEA